MKKIFSIIGVVIFLLVVKSVYSEAAKLECNLSDEMVSAYITRSGGQIGDGVNNQATFTLGVGSLYGFGFDSYDFNAGRETEHDVGFGKVFKSEKILLDLSWQKKWLGNFREDALEAKAEYECPVKISLIWTKVISKGISSDWNRFYLEFKKPFNVGAVTFSPLISTAYLNNFYAEHGFAHITGGFSAEYPLAKNTRIFSAVKYQEGLIHSKKSLSYGGAGIRLIF